MRVIFMGTPDFAVGTLEEIIKAGHEVVLVVSQPDKAVGRSKALKYTPVKECAIAHGIEVYQPEKIRNNESIEYLRGYQADIIIVVAFGQLIPKAILDMPKYGCVNVHASLLPKYRGAAPIQWAVINGDAVTGVTTQRMDEGLDTGDIIMKEEVVIREDETGGSLFDRLSEVGAQLCVRTMAAIADGTAEYTPQDSEMATHTAKIYKEMGSIDWSEDAEHIECLIRGLNPWPSAYTKLEDKTFKIWKAQVISHEKIAAPGCIVKVEKDIIYVQAGNGILGLKEVQLEGKKRMSVEAFLNGYVVEEGTYFKKG
jgi:methionyl-tRNA formyltransferase